MLASADSIHFTGDETSLVELGQQQQGGQQQSLRAEAWHGWLQESHRKPAFFVKEAGEGFTHNTCTEDNIFQ